MDNDYFIAYGDVSHSVCNFFSVHCEGGNENLSGTIPSGIKNYIVNGFNWGYIQLVNISK